MLPGSSRASHSPTHHTPDHKRHPSYQASTYQHTLLQLAHRTEPCRVLQPPPSSLPCTSCRGCQDTLCPQHRATAPVSRRIEARAAPPHLCFQTRSSLGWKKEPGRCEGVCAPAAKAHTPALLKPPGRNSPTALSCHATTQRYSVPTPVSEGSPSASAPSCAAGPVVGSAAAQTTAPTPAAAAAGPVPA